MALLHRTMAATMCFVHITAVQRAGLDGLNDNQKVSFEVETGRNGREAATDLQAQ
jgi:CspA family cold shock protein